jgi:hypothetical protein
MYCRDTRGRRSSQFLVLHAGFKRSNATACFRKSLASFTKHPNADILPNQEIDFKKSISGGKPGMFSEHH